MTTPADSKKPKNDRALRFYRDVLGLERLHYGIWNLDDELTMDKLKEAQERYETYLVESIPDGARTVLDVGCGSGELCMRLKHLGYDIEGLSPDRNQKVMFAEKVDAPFHFTRFEEAQLEKKYDCIIMSESCQYIPMEKVFEVAKSALKDDGRLMIIDYFVVDQNAGMMSKSGHDYNKFLDTAKASGMEIEKRRDVTAETAKTMDCAKLWADKILLGADILTEKFRDRNPRTWKFVKWVFRKKIKKVMDQMDLLDAESFAKAKKYEFFLFKNV
ncbi:MAG: methyltransferase domain-containing protein [Verrucomicrobiota bacterium]